MANTFVWMPEWMKRLEIEKLRELVQVHPTGTCKYCDSRRVLGFVEGSTHDEPHPAPPKAE